jgi:hypothetical protein
MADGEAHEVGEQEEVGQLESDSLDVRALFLLGIQQTSSSFSYRAAEFAFPLYFISLFTNTLLPASVRVCSSIRKRERDASVADKKCTSLDLWLCHHW